jgi:hypothetical protein
MLTLYFSIKHSNTTRDEFDIIATKSSANMIKMSMDSIYKTSLQRGSLFTSDVHTDKQMLKMTAFE